MPNHQRPIPDQQATTDRAELYRQARGWLIAAASADILEHCSEDDRVRLLSSAIREAHDVGVVIPELNEQTRQLTDGVVEQAIATIAMLISKNQGIKIAKQGH